MNYNNLTALLVWAKDTDRMNVPVSKEVLSKFKDNAKGVQKIFTDPNEPLYYCENVVGEDPIHFFTRYILSFAKSKVISGLENYGRLNKSIVTWDWKRRPERKSFVLSGWTEKSED